MAGGKKLHGFDQKKNFLLKFWNILFFLGEIRRNDEKFVAKICRNDEKFVAIIRENGEKFVEMIRRR